MWYKTDQSALARRRVGNWRVTGREVLWKWPRLTN
jgi:hypothetical protein